MGKYYWRVLQAAFTHSLGAVDLWTGVAIAVLGLVDHLMPQPHLMTEYAWQIPVWAVAAVLGLRLLLAPFRLAKEDAGQIAALKLAVHDKDARQKALDQLWALRKIGVGLRNEPVEEATMESWLRRQNEWRQSVYEAAGGVSINLRNHLEILNEVGAAPAPSLAAPYVLRIKNQLHLHFVTIISEILRRLERYLEKDL